MKTYKGTDKGMKCRGFQYELGVTVKTDDAIRCGDKGFHSCKAPFDVLRYYPNKDGNRFFVATAGGKIDRTDANDSKIASTELTLDEEIGLADLTQAQIEYTHTKAESGECSGESSNLLGGDGSVIVGREHCRAKSGLNSVIVLSEWAIKDEEYKPVCVKAEIVDGVRIKADTWYKLENGEFVEDE